MTSQEERGPLQPRNNNLLLSSCYRCRRVANIHRKEQRKNCLLDFRHSCLEKQKQGGLKIKFYARGFVGKHFFCVLVHMHTKPSDHFQGTGIHSNLTLYFCNVDTFVQCWWSGPLSLGFRRPLTWLQSFGSGLFSGQAFIRPIYSEVSWGHLFPPALFQPWS